MIKLNHLHYNYKRQLRLFSDLKLETRPGNIYGLLGKNGAGKTSLLRLISGLLFPKSGDLSVMGYEPARRQPAFLSELYFLQEELHLPPVRIDAFRRLYASFYPRFDDNQFRTYLEEFEIDSSKPIPALSFGQRKKVLVSFGLATNCKLLLLDEPTNGLDIPSKSKFRKLLSGSIGEDRTFIISTHQVRDLANLIDPVIFLDKGEIIFNRGMDEVTDRLYFQPTFGTEPPEDAIYSERVPGGYMVVTENTNGEASELDLEVLFNAVTTNKTRIDQIFGKEATHES